MNVPGIENAWVTEVRLPDGSETRIREGPMAVLLAAEG